MTPKELYNLTPKSVTSDLYGLNRFINEAAFDFPENDPYRIIQIKTLEDQCFDGYRTWTLQTVWYGPHPVMVIQSAGRAGDDHRAKFITDMEMYVELIKRLFQLSVDSKEFFTYMDDPVDEDNDLPELTEFYGGKFIPD